MARCQLCGGKLHGNICTECGLDNSKTDAQYKMGRSNCETEPLTHIHYEQGEEQMNTKTRKRGYGKKGDTSMPTFNMSDVENMMKKKPRAKKPVGRLIKIIVVLAIVWSMVGSLVTEFGKSIYQNIDNISSGEIGDLFSGYTMKVQEDSYSSVTRSLSEDGFDYKDTLAPGFYTVGYQIPEGQYELSLDGTETMIQVHDTENGIWLYESLDESETKKLTNVRLYEGAIVQISGNAKVDFDTKNGQVEAMDSSTLVDNPLTQPVTLKETMTAGVDFEAGVYDLTDTKEENPSVKLYVPGHISEDSETQTITFNYVFSDEENYGGNQVLNVVIPEGTKVVMDYDCEVEMTPSPQIVGTDYMNFYDKNY